MSTFTATKQLEQIGHGADVGIWDTPTNSNWGIVDSALAGIATIPLNNTPVILNTAQFQQSQIVFNSTLTGNVSITFPTSFTGPYIIQNNCTGSSAFVITLQTTAAGGQAVGCPFGEIFDVFNDGANIKFRNFDRIGAYWDYAGSSVPSWVSACTVPPYLYCNGTTFSSATYPVLTTIFGSTTLPDFRGRTAFYLNDGTGRITAGAGIDGNTLFAAGGTQTNTLVQANIPVYDLPYTDLGHTHDNTVNTNGPHTAQMISGATFSPGNAPTGSAVTGITIHSGGSGTAFNLLNPGAVGGIRMVRAG